MSNKILVAICLVGLLAIAMIGSAEAASVPREANKWKRVLIREAQLEWGLNAPVARFAAQIHQESSWRSNAQSQYADGLAQFTPPTAKWIAEIYPNKLTSVAPFSPQWAIKAMVIYDRHLLKRIKGKINPIPASDLWAMILSAYNGGLTWVNRDRKLAMENGANPDRWWGETERFTARAAWAKKENRHYPRSILCDHEPMYRDAGWPGDPVCG